MGAGEDLELIFCFVLCVFVSMGQVHLKRWLRKCIGRAALTFPFFLFSSFFFLHLPHHQSLSRVHVCVCIIATASKQTVGRLPVVLSNVFLFPVSWLTSGRGQGIVYALVGR